jgi:hypothetical protein
MVILIINPNMLSQMQGLQGQGGIPGLPNMLGQLPAQSAAGSSLPSKDETRLKPYLRICKVIEEKRGEIQSLLINKFRDVFLNKATLVNNPAELYKTITNSTIDVVLSHIKSMFTDDNLRIMAFKLAKDAYKANAGGDSIFSAKSLDDFNKKFNGQLDASLEITRAKVSEEPLQQEPEPLQQEPEPLQQEQASLPSYLQGQNNSIQPVNPPPPKQEEGEINAYGSKYGDVPISESPDEKKPSQTGGAEQDTDLVVIFNKLYGNEAFQKKLSKMISVKIGRIIDSPEIKKQLLSTIQSKIEQVKQTIDSQLDKLLRNLNNDKAMNLFMIKALGDKYVREYFKNSQGKTLEQYIDDSILSEEQLAVKNIRSKQTGGKRKTKRRQQNKRRKRSSTKNIA